MNIDKKSRLAMRSVFFIFLALFAGIGSCYVCFWGILGTFNRYDGLSISPDGIFFAITDSTSLTVYRIADRSRVIQEDGHFYGFQPYDQGYFSTIKWAPVETYLAVGEIYSGVQIWDTKSWQRVSTMEGMGNPYNTSNEPGFSWSPDGKSLALGANDGSVWVWTSEKNQWVKVSPTDEVLRAITWYENGSIIKLSGNNLTLLDGESIQNDLKLNIDGYGKISFSPDENHLYSFFDLGGGILSITNNEWEYNAGYFPDFAWSPNGHFFASVQECDNELKIWDTVNNQIVKQERQGHNIYALAFSPLDELFALGFLDYSVAVWNTATGKVALRLFRPPTINCFD